MSQNARLIRFSAAMLFAACVSAHADTRIGTTMTVGSFTNPSVTNQAVEFEAIINGFVPSGTVTFTEGADVLCSAVPVASSSSTGIADCTATFGQGAHTVSASYSGDADNLPSAGCVVQLVGTDPIWTDGFECL